mmetsp:Transcript_6907/g.14268  ORF Transcript_6907/g.14268 Transcript_6907/m.14268 type:complete len:233 (-) Transcript_6907:236-934(-)
MRIELVDHHELAFLEQRLSLVITFVLVALLFLFSSPAFLLEQALVFGIAVSHQCKPLLSLLNTCGSQVEHLLFPVPHGSCVHIENVPDLAFLFERLRGGLRQHLSLRYVDLASLIRQRPSRVTVRLVVREDSLVVECEGPFRPRLAVPCAPPSPLLVQSSYLPRSRLGVRDVASGNCMVRRYGCLSRRATSTTSSRATCGPSTSAGGCNHGAAFLELLEAESAVFICIVTIE